MNFCSDCKHRIISQGYGYDRCRQANHISEDPVNGLNVTYSACCKIRWDADLNKLECDKYKPSNWKVLKTWLRIIGKLLTGKS